MRTKAGMSVAFNPPKNHHRELQSVTMSNSATQLSFGLAHSIDRSDCASKTCYRYPRSLASLRLRTQDMSRI